MSITGIIYILTATISVILGLLLVFYSKATSHGGVSSAGGSLRKKDIPLADMGGDSLRQAMYEEIREIVGSRRKSEEISKRVSDVFAKELNKKMDLQKRELIKKYETVIQQKTHEQEIAWKKYKKTLMDKKQTEAVMHSITEGLVVVDSQGKVIMMNPAAEKLLGAPKKDKIGKSLLEGLKEEQLVSLVKTSSGKGEGKEIELISKEEETKRVLRASSAVVEDENGQTVGMVSVLSDITKQKELDRLKSNFVANVSHELRTPLVSIDKSLALLLSGDQGAVSPTQKQLLSIAQRNLKRLSNLINDLLDLSKLEAGRMEIKRESVSIKDVIFETVEGLSTWARSKSIQMSVDVADNLPNVNIDPNRIAQVLNNLIGNAIKFTPANGKITVFAELADNPRCIKISVQDTGIGIPKEDLDKVFDRFYQSGERSLTDISGTGIGLAISKEIVELHGGRIWAESEPEKGARFIFTLPLS